MTNVYPKSTENLGIPSGDWSDVEDFAEKKSTVRKLENHLFNKSN